jgi:hypothetical protein
MIHQETPMTLKPIPGFKSLETHHCVTGSMRHVYEHHGCSISEDLLFGLGAGIGFVYWHMKGTDPFIGGRGNVGRSGEEGLEKTAGRRTGVIVEAHSTGSTAKAEKTLLESLEGGEPVMIQVDMGFLPYLELPEEYHFGGHVVVVAGLDRDHRQVLVADRDAGIHPTSLDDLAQARSSRFQPFPPRNTWYSFDFSGFRPPTSADVWAAIEDALATMLDPPISNLGVRGIRKAAKRIRKWPSIMDDEQLRRTSFNTFIFIDATGGTGGGIFRYMYSRFLNAAASITGNRQLTEVGKSLHSIGDRWQDVAAIFEQALTVADPAADLPGISDQLLEIADLEEEAWLHLREIAAAR